MLLIKNGKVLTMAGEILEQGCVLVENDKIIEVGDRIEEKEDYTVIDAKGLWVMPGIIEAHCHIGITEEKKGAIGDDCNESTSPVTPYLRALDAVNPLDPAFHTAIQAGITSVMVGPGSTNVVGGQFIFMKTHGRIIDRMVLLAPAAMKISFGENPKTSYKDLNSPPATRMAIA
ncbi:MAG TPA: amidohydrolase, partial [Lachnospiraceae bacterium]|nr:amidohydrolase [Lachnospiraceae bacterium]